MCALPICRRVTLEIYGRREQARLADQVAQVYAAPTRPLRVVAVEAIRGGRGVRNSVRARVGGVLRLVGGNCDLVLRTSHDKDVEDGPE